MVRQSRIGEFDQVTAQPEALYAADDLTYLEGLDAVRKRPGMYIGSTDSRGLMHLCNEIIDNSTDEGIGGYATRVEVTVRGDGSVQVDAGYFIQTDDGVVIHVHNVGVIVPAPGGGLGYAWVAPSFDAPTGKYDWLNKAIFVSRIGPAGDKDHPAVRITIWKVG